MKCVLSCAVLACGLAMVVLSPTPAFPQDPGATANPWGTGSPAPNLPPEAYQQPVPTYQQPSPVSAWPPNDAPLPYGSNGNVPDNLPPPVTSSVPDPAVNPPVAPSTPLDTIPHNDLMTPRVTMVAPPKEEKKEEEKKPPKPWEGSVELGLNGTDGTSDTFNVHTGAKIKYKLDLNTFTSELNYHRTATGSVETANQGTLESRFEHLFAKDSPWTWFVQETLDYDEFKPYDLQLGLNTGLGYNFIKNDDTTLTGRFGGGTSKQFGRAASEEWKPEVLLGLDLEHKINKTNKITLSCEYTPNVDKFNTDFRVRSKASWEILLSEEYHLNLKLSLIDLYESDSAGAPPNNLEYAVTLLWGF